MNDRFMLTGTVDEARVLHEALIWYRGRAEQRYDPNFTPAPGKKDRNVEIMRIVDILTPHLRPQEELRLVIDYDGRRVVRNALQAYAEFVASDPEVIDCDADTALQVMDRIPYNYVKRQPVHDAEVDSPIK